MAALARHEINHAQLISLHFRLLEQHSCSRALALLAQSRTSSKCFMKLPMLRRLLISRTASNEELQLPNLRLLVIVLSSWRGRAPELNNGPMAGASEAVPLLLELRGMVALKCCLENPCTQGLAASCIRQLALLWSSPSAIASSGAFQLLLQKMTLPEQHLESQAALTSAVTTQLFAAETISLVIEDADCAAIALEQGNLRAIRWRFNGGAPARQPASSRARQRRAARA